MGESTWILFGLLVLLVLNYLVQIVLQRIKPQLMTTEGFSETAETVEYLKNDEHYMTTIKNWNREQVNHTEVY